MSSAVPAIWRARTLAGRRLTTCSTDHASAGASTTEPSAPSFASSRRCPLNARLEISSETVKPMPANAPPAASSGELSGERGPRTAGREASQEAPAIPSGLPAT